MSDSPPIYRRLPGTGRTLLGYDRLWLADDHLLVSKMRGFAETYERFYLRDIQALIFRQTPRRLQWGVVLGGPTLLFALLALWAGPFGRPGWIAIAAFFLLLLSIHWLRGPTSVCHLRTPLQTVELTPLRRMRNARRVTADLQLRIEQVQGMVSAEEIESGLLEVPAQSVPQPTAGLRLNKPPPLPRPYHGAWHATLFVALLIEALVTALQLTSDNSALHYFAAVLFVVEFGLAIAAVALQRRSELSTGLKRIAWAALGLLCLIVVSGWGFSMVIAFQAAMTQTPLDARSVAQFPALRWLYIPSMAATATVGLWGLALLLRFRGARRET